MIKGVIYVFTTPSYPDTVKIGYAQNVHERLDCLNRNSAVMHAFHIYATYEVEKKLLIKCYIN